jgi:multiple sugar transport system ATP-binding protein
VYRRCMAAVVLDHVSKVYDGGVLAVDDLSLEIASGELLVLLGPSGCGKTSTLRIVAGLEELTSGDVWLGGELANDVPPHLRGIAMVFQSGALYPHMTVRGNLAFPLQAEGTADKEHIASRVLEVARGLGIEEMLDRRPALLSGGERQRVAMGRALMRGSPQVLLMDEPLASLDAALRAGLRDEIRALVQSLGLTTLYVTHDQVEALTLADRIAVIRGGKLEDIGTPAQIYEDPATAFVAAFLGTPPINLASATIWVDIGDRIVIDFGTQTLSLPWSDPRSDRLTPYHGQTVIAGIRPDVLTPTSSADGPQLLRGRVYSLEFHGHEWLARLEMGLHLVDIGLGSTPEPGGHRRANLLVRLGSPRGWAVGREVSVVVDVPRVFFFDMEGKRIDSSPLLRPATAQPG